MDLPGRVYDFGRFRLDTCERVLFCADEPVHLTLKAFAVLRVLVENAGHVVEKEAFIRGDFESLQQLAKRKSPHPSRRPPAAGSPG